MKIQINIEQKRQLLQSVATGVFDSKIFPELYKFEPAKILTKQEARELWNDLEADNFEKINPAHFER